MLVVPIVMTLLIIILYYYGCSVYDKIWDENNDDWCPDICYDEANCDHDCLFKGYLFATLFTWLPFFDKYITNDIFNAVGINILLFIFITWCRTKIFNKKMKLN